MRVERFCADSLGDCMLWSFSIFIDDSSAIFWWFWRANWTIGRATVSISALNIDETNVGRPLVISRGDLCEGPALCRCVDVCIGCFLWCHEWGRKWHNYRGCSCYRGTGAWCVESEHLIWTCGTSIDDKIVRRHEAFAWWPGWAWVRQWITSWNILKVTSQNGS